MFWKSNKEAKDEIFLQRQLISNIENILEALAISQVSTGEKIDKLHETMVEIFTSEEEGSCLNRIHKKLNTLIEELKGCILVAHAPLKENTSIKKKESNIAAVYKTICDIQEKKSPKRRKKTKKKKDFPASQLEGSE